MHARTSRTSEAALCPVVNEPFTLSYTIRNRTLQMATLTATVESVEHVAFAGNKVATLKLLPLASHEVALSCIALRCGKVQIPRLALTRVLHAPTGPRMLKLPLGEEGERRLVATILPCHTPVPEASFQ